MTIFHRFSIVLCIMAMTNGYVLRNHRRTSEPSKRNYGYMGHHGPEIAGPVEYSRHSTDILSTTTSSPILADESSQSTDTLSDTTLSPTLDITSKKSRTSTTSDGYNYDSLSEGNTKSSTSDSSVLEKEFEPESSFTAHTHKTTVVPSFLLDLISTFTDSVKTTSTNIKSTTVGEQQSTEFDYSSTTIDIGSTTIDNTTSARYVIPIESTESAETTDGYTTTLETSHVPTEEDSVKTTLDTRSTTLLTLNTKYTTQTSTQFYRHTTVVTTEPSLDSVETSTSGDLLVHRTTYTDIETTTVESNTEITPEDIPSSTLRQTTTASDLETTALQKSTSTLRQTTSVNDLDTTSTSGDSTSSTTSEPLGRSTTSEPPVDDILRKLSSMKHPKHLLHQLMCVGGFKTFRGSKTMTSKINKKRLGMFNKILESIRGR